MFVQGLHDIFQNIKGKTYVLLWAENNKVLTENWCALLIPTPELAKLGLTCTKFCLRCIDMVYERRSEYDNSIIHTRASNIVYFRLFFVF